MVNGQYTFILVPDSDVLCDENTLLSDRHEIVESIFPYRLYIVEKNSVEVEVRFLEKKLEFFLFVKFLGENYDVSFC